MSKLATAPMLLLAALLLVRAAAAEAGARLSASMAGTLERQAQLAARPAGHLEMRSSSSTVGARQEAVADYAARLKDALVGGQPPAPGTPGTFSTAAPHPLPHQHLPSTLRAPRSHSEQLTAAAPAGQKPTTSSYPARQQLSHGSISPTTAASLASQAMLRELVADAAEAAAASAALPLPPTQASTTVAATGAASKPSARATWSAELIFDRNASSFGFSNRPGAGVNSSERGAFDIRAGWSTKRRYIHLPGANAGSSSTIQEVVETRVFFSISALALACLATALLLLAVNQCMAEERAQAAAEEEEEEPAQAGSDEGAAFIKQIGYVKL